MYERLVYVTSNWNDLLKYRNDGHYTIDNMLAERAVRLFTVKRKTSLFFSSEDGIESALKYHTLIEIYKNVGLNVKGYFTYVFGRLIEGEKDYKSFSPVLLHSKIKQTKVKTKIINGSPSPVYKGLESIECLLYKGLCPKLSTNLN